MSAGLGFFNWILYIDLLVVSVVVSVYVYISQIRASETRVDDFSHVSLFLLAGRNLHFVPAAITYFAAFFSSITILGIPAEIYSYGITYIFISIGYAIACFIAHVFFNPVYYNLGIYSVYEYIGIRFSRINQIMCAITFIIQMLLYLGIVLYVPSMTFSIVVDVNKWIMVITAAIISTLYTTLGGFISIVYTSMFQIVMLFVGLLPIIIKGTELAGGFAKLWETAADEGKLDLNYSLDMKQRCTVAGMIIGGAFLWMGMNCASQTTVQRINACKTKAYTKITMILVVVLMNLLLFFLILCGLIVCFQFKHDAVNKTVFNTTQSDVLLVQFVLDELKQYPGVLGLFLVSVMSASLSTISAGLNSLAAVTLRNICPLLNTNINDDIAYRYLRYCTFGYGITIMLFAYLSSLSENILHLAYSIFGLVSGPVLGIYFMGLFLPICNFKGAILGQIISQLFLFWIMVGHISHGIHYSSFHENKTNHHDFRLIYNKKHELISGIENIYAISVFWYGFIGCLLTIFIGLIVSFLTRHEIEKKSVPIEFITPPLRNFWRSDLKEDLLDENESNIIFR